MKIYSNPNQPDGYTDYRRCDACGMWNKIGRTPEGGEYVATTRDSVTNDPVYAGNGCWFCGSPAWRNGGKLGDMARVR